ncbi:MAG: ScyD/ScyE family protein [Segetibacter sp.]
MLALTTFILSVFFTACKKESRPPEFKISVVASGLVNPMGIEADGAGNIWVSESGTAKNDAKVVLIKPNGKTYDAIVNLSAFINENSGEPQGAAHLLLDFGILYILLGTYMFKANVSSFKPGDAPIDGSKLPYEDIGSFVRSYPFVNNAHDTHPYNLTKGPDGDIYIADAGANAIIHRKSAGSYSVLAEIPGFANPTPVGPPQVQSVPTGLFFDGQNFLVTTLTGFPFITGKAVVYKVSPAGNVSLYQPGFTTLVDIVEGNMNGHLVLQYGAFGQTGFVPNTGSLILINGSSSQVLTNSLNMPVALKQVNPYTWYITSMGDGTVLKASYN